jgi:hypothetical protein
VLHHQGEQCGLNDRWPSLPTYTAEDMHAEAAKIATLPIIDNLTFGQIWDQLDEDKVENKLRLS